MYQIKNEDLSESRQQRLWTSFDSGCVENDLSDMERESLSHLS